MVAQRHGVVVHHVESHVKGFPALDVRENSALIDVAAIQQQQFLRVVVGATAADVVGLVGHVRQPVVVGTGRRVHQRPVDIGGLHDG